MKLVAARAPDAIEGYRPEVGGYLCACVSLCIVVVLRIIYCRHIFRLAGVIAQPILIITEPVVWPLQCLSCFFYSTLG